MDLYYIYKITNNITGETYIGRKKYSIGKRRHDGNGYYTDDYESLITDNYWGRGRLITKAIKEFGKENFTKEILVSHLEFKEAANEAEKVFIKCYRDLGKAEYNIADGGDGFPCQHTEASKAKMSKSHKGKNHSEEHRRNLAEANKAEGLRRKLSGENKGLHWFNNGTVEIFRHECPEGFKPGRLIKNLYYQH